MTTQFCFKRRSHLQNQSHSYPMLFSSQSAPDSISYESSVSFSMYTTPISSITSLSCLVFIIHSTRLDQSQNFSIVFDVDHTCTIDHIIALSGFLQRPLPVKYVSTIQFRFQCRPDLYNPSHRCPTQFSSKIVLGPIGYNKSILFSTQTTSILPAMLFSYLVFVTVDTQSN